MRVPMQGAGQFVVGGLRPIVFGPAVFFPRHAGLEPASRFLPSFEEAGPRLKAGVTASVWNTSAHRR